MSGSSDFEARASTSTQVCNRLTHCCLQSAEVVNLQRVELLPGFSFRSGCPVCLLKQSSVSCTGCPAAQLASFRHKAPTPVRKCSAVPSVHLSALLQQLTVCRRHPTGCTWTSQLGCTAAQVSFSHLALDLCDKVSPDTRNSTCKYLYSPNGCCSSCISPKNRLSPEHLKTATYSGRCDNWLLTAEDPGTPCLGVQFQNTGP